MQIAFSGKNMNKMLVTLYSYTPDPDCFEGRHIKGR